MRGALLPLMAPCKHLQPNNHSKDLDSPVRLQALDPALHSKLLTRALHTRGRPIKAPTLHNPRALAATRPSR
jgi:hypothetical protein